MAFRNVRRRRGDIRSRGKIVICPNCNCKTENLGNGNYVCDNGDCHIVMFTKQKRIIKPEQQEEKDTW